MTREEAISELQKAIDLIKQNGKDWLDERDIPILQMAITALELSDSIMLQLDCKMFHSGVNVDNTVSDETTDIIYRQAAIDAINHICPVDTEYDCTLLDRVDVRCVLSDLPSSQPEITPDGTLNVSIDADIASVGRILLSQTGTQYGGLYYKDEQPEIIRCKDCKWKQGAECVRFAEIRVFPNDFCSRAERRTDG